MKVISSFHTNNLFFSLRFSYAITSFFTSYCVFSFLCLVDCTMYKAYNTRKAILHGYFLFIANHCFSSTSKSCVTSNLCSASSGYVRNCTCFSVVPQSIMEMLNFKDSDDYFPAAVKIHKLMPVYQLHFSNIDSTQKWALRNFCKIMEKHKLKEFEWIAITADKQIKGIGAKLTAEGKETSWLNKEGNVFVTYLIPWKKEKSHLFFNFPQVTSVAIVKTLESFGIKNSEIKWVNDVLIRGKKISGVLCHMPGYTINILNSSFLNTYNNNYESCCLNEKSTEMQYKCAFVGIGINVNSSVEDLQNVGQPATSMHIEILNEIHRKRSKNKNREASSANISNGGLDRKAKQMNNNDQNALLCNAEDVLNILTENLYKEMYTLEANGFSTFLSRIDNRLAFKGKHILFQDNENIHRGILDGLNNDGSIRLKTTTGVQSFFSGRIIRFSS